MAQPKLTDLSDHALLHASKANLLEFFRTMGKAPGVRSGEENGLFWYRSGMEFPWFNGVILERATGEEGAGPLARAIELAQVEGVPVTLWVNQPEVEEAWRPALEAAGCEYDSGVPGMGYDLAALPAALDLPAGFTISRVESRAELAEWCGVCAAGFDLPDSFAASLQATMEGLAQEAPDLCANYLGRLDGEAVATSNVFYGADVAGIQFVSTLPAARRRGLGGLMTLAPFHDARARGYRVGILQSSEMGFPVYKRLGFRDAGRVDNWYKPAPQRS